MLWFTGSKIDFKFRGSKVDFKLTGSKIDFKSKIYTYWRTSLQEEALDIVEG